MKKLLLVFAAITLLFTACKKDNVKEESKLDTKQNTVESTTNENAELLNKYHKEGFLDKNTFVVIIIKPSDSNLSFSEMKQQGKDRALVSIKRFLKSKGKRIDNNTNASILRLINNNGNLIRIDDKSKSRIVYVYEIKKTNLYREISSLGV